MKPFPYDEFYPTFMEELKSLFSRFIKHNKDKKPYFFALKASACVTLDSPTCLYANGNTMVDFESAGRASAAKYNSDLVKTIVKMESDGESEDEIAKWYKFIDSEALYYNYKYNSEEWINETFTDNEFPKSNAIVLNYYKKNEKDVFDEDDDKDENISSDSYDRDSGYSIEFIKFRTEFFNFLIRCLKQLRDEKYFESMYPERILINFEVWEYYNEDEMMGIFEELNTKEEAKLFARFLYG